MTAPTGYNTSELPPETAPENLSVMARGFHSTKEAKRVAYAVGTTVRLVSRFINLERIDGITIAFDYSEALAAVDRGYPGARVPEATNNTEIAGVAMAVNVLREGVIKTHLVFKAECVCPLVDDAHPAFPLALSLVAHECGHVADLKVRDEAFPGTVLQQSYKGGYEGLIFPVAEVLWEEYAACRASAFFGQAETPRYEESLISMLGVALPRTDEAIQHFRVQQDIRRVLVEAGSALSEPLRMMAYLIGHLDGLGQDIDAAPATRDVLAKSAFGPLSVRMTAILRDLWSRRGQWKSLDEFQPLRQICHDAFAIGGIFLTPDSKGGASVQIL